MISDFLRLLQGFILFIGPSEAGKTSILRRLLKGTFEDQTPTLGFLEEYIANVKVIEIGGQKSYRHYWTTALEQNPSHIFFIIDVTKEIDFEEYTELIKSVADTNPILSKDITLIGNKMDLVSVTPSHLDDLEHKILCSAKEGDGMLDILEAIASLRNDTDSARSVSNKPQLKEKMRIEEKQKVEGILKSFQGKLDKS
jgi:GTPase SAR1 family protein